MYDAMKCLLFAWFIYCSLLLLQFKKIIPVIQCAMYIVLLIRFTLKIPGRCVSLQMQRYAHCERETRNTAKAVKSARVIGYVDNNARCDGSNPAGHSAFIFTVEFFRFGFRFRLVLTVRNIFRFRVRLVVKIPFQTYLNLPKSSNSVIVSVEAYKMQ